MLIRILVNLDMEYRKSVTNLRGIGQHLLTPKTFWEKKVRPYLHNVEKQQLV